MAKRRYRKSRVPGRYLLRRYKKKIVGLYHIHRSSHRTFIKVSERGALHVGNVVITRVSPVRRCVFKSLRTYQRHWLYLQVTIIAGFLIAREIRLYMNFDILTGPCPYTAWILGLVFLPYLWSLFLYQFIWKWYLRSCSNYFHHLVCFTVNQQYVSGDNCCQSILLSTSVGM